MKNSFPSSRMIKTEARRRLAGSAVLRLTLLFVGLQMVFLALQFYSQGGLTYYAMDLAEYSETRSGLFFTDEGFSLIFRMDIAGTVLAMPVTYTQLARFLGFNAIIFLVLAPLRVGVMEQYWEQTRIRKSSVRAAFRWFMEPMRLIRSVVVEFVLQILVRGIGVLLTVPGFYMYYLLYTTTPTVDDWTAASTALQLGAMTELLLAGIITYYIHSCLLPIRYCLASHPEYSIIMVFQRGISSLSGFRGRFFRFRLGFLLWFLMSQLTYSAMDIFVLPYSSASSMIFLQQAARVRQLSEDSEPENE